MLFIIIHILFLMCENVSNDTGLFFQFLIVAILSLKIAAIILDESVVSRNFLKSSVVECAKIYTFITLYPLSSGISLIVDLR